MRLLGVTIPDTKHIEIALTEVYGIGRSRARVILKTAEVPFDKKTKELTEAEEAAIRKLAEAYTLEGELKREIGGNIKRLKDVSSYRGSRHAKHLPTRGQRTKTNSRTVRGNVRKTMGSGRRKLEKT
jgi:small subunit ribosomal protein S13